MVYKAKDTRLDRTVAIKVPPSHLSDNSQLKERFEREARAVSSLNHPHICTLQDVGQEFPSKLLTLYREPTSLVVGETKFPSRKPSFDDFVLLEQVDDSGP
jgi:serine/threonine protein kinase